MKNLAHDLNTLTRVYLYVGGLRDEYISCDEDGDCRSAICALGFVLDTLNEWMDENFADIDARGLNGFEREADETSSVAFEDLDNLPF